MSVPRTIHVDFEFLRAPARVIGSARAYTLFGIPVTFGLSYVFAAALGIWTFTDTILPVAAPGRSALAYWTGGAAATLLVLMSVVVHELGHAVAALRAGLGVRGMTLSFFGGATEFVDAPRSPAMAFAIVVAGPLASLALALGFTLTHVALVELEADPLAAAIPAIAAVVNLAIAVLNVLPGLPLDGGHGLAALVWRVTGRAADGTRVAARVGRVLAIIIGGFAIVGSASGDAGLSLWLALVSIVIWHDADRAIGGSVATSSTRDAVEHEREERGNDRASVRRGRRPAAAA